MSVSRFPSIVFLARSGRAPSVRLLRLRVTFRGAGKPTLVSAMLRDKVMEVRAAVRAHRLVRGGQRGENKVAQNAQELEK